MSVKGDEEQIKALDDFKEKAKKEAEILVRDVFPKKVFHLTSLLESELFDYTNLNKISVDINIPIPKPIYLDSTTNHVEKTDGELTQLRKRKHVSEDIEITGTKVTALNYGSVPCNKNIVDIVDILKPEVRGLIDYANQIKMWITYMVPRIEDGNNFGVGVQEDTLAETRQCEADAAGYLDAFSRYFMARGKIISKVAKYPNLEDYRRTIKEFDEKEFVNLRLIVCELRNTYSSLHDLILKNLDKIKKPRSANTMHMY